MANVLSGVIQTTNGQSVNVLGYVTWWNVRDVVANQQWFKAKLDEVGLNGGKYAREHNYRATFIRCLRSMEENKIIRKVSETGASLIYQFTTETLVNVEGETPRLDYKYETSVEIDKQSYWTDGDFAKSLIKCDPALKNTLVNLFEQERQTYRSSDLTRYIQRILSDEADLVSLRPQGSVYFVPVAFQSLIAKLAQVLAAVPQGYAQLEFFPVPDVESARSMVSTGVQAEVTEVFDKLDAEIQKMQSGNDSITEKWVEHRKERIQEIKRRLDMYAEVLGDTATRLHGQFDALTVLLKPRVLEV